MADIAAALERTREALERVARAHHATIAPSKLHNPEDVCFDRCQTKTCQEAHDGLAAVDAIEAHIAEIERERDYFRDRLPDFSAVAQADFARAEAAERELEHWKGANLYPSTYREAVEKLHIAERRVEELEAALREIREWEPGSEEWKIARRALKEGK